MHLLFFFLFFFRLFADPIVIDGKLLHVEIADTNEKKAKGLMGRRFLKEGSGMLFIYDKPQKLSFWMKNTHVPLSIAFFDKDKRLLQIIDMDPPVADPPPHYTSASPAMYALEVPQGWFSKEKIKVGAKFSFIVE